MVRIRRRLGITIIVLVLVIISVLILAPIACTSSQDTINLPPFDSLDKGNPKLDSQLNQLVRAETRGEAIVLPQKAAV